MAQRKQTQTTTSATAEPRSKRPASSRQFPLEADDVLPRSAGCLGISPYARDAEARLLCRWRLV